jgi:hypothetical protein
VAISPPIVSAYYLQAPNRGRELSFREAVLPLMYRVREDGLQKCHARPNEGVGQETCPEVHTEAHAQGRSGLGNELPGSAGSGVRAGMKLQFSGVNEQPRSYSGGTCIVAVSGTAIGAGPDAGAGAGAATCGWGLGC